MTAAKKASLATPKFPKQTPAADTGKSPAELIDARIAELQDWRGARLARIRALIRSAGPDVTEEWKWNTPVWSCHGIICTGETYKSVVKLTFPKGASLADPAQLFNSSLEGKVRRAVDFPEGGALDAAALTDLVRAAMDLNKSSTGRSEIAHRVSLNGGASRPVSLRPDSIAQARDHHLLHGEQHEPEPSSGFGQARGGAQAGDKGSRARRDLER